MSRADDLCEVILIFYPEPAITSNMKQPGSQEDPAYDLMTSIYLGIGK